MRFSLLVLCGVDRGVELLDETIVSVLEQTSPSWELVVAVPSVNARLRRRTRRAIAGDPRVHVVTLAADCTPASAMQAAYEASSGEFFAFVDAGDLLARHALERVEAAIDADPSVDCWYTDEDTVDAEGVYHRAFYKPDWSPERLRSQPYLGDLLVIRRQLIDSTDDGAAAVRLQALQPGAERYDLALRATEGSRVGHVPGALYHRRQRHDSTYVPDDDAAVDALTGHLERVSIDAEVAVDRTTHTYHVRRSLASEPLVSFIIPTRGSVGRVWGTDRVFVTEAVRSVVARSTYRNFEIVVVFDTVTPTGALDELRSIAGDRLRLVAYDRPFNFSEKINLGRRHANGELLLLFNDDIEVISDDFVETLAGLAVQSDVGAVGAKLLLADGRLQHGGHVYNGEPHHILWGRHRTDPGPFGLLAVRRECIGVTAACLMTRAEVFDEVGGFATFFPIDFNDVDFALKLQRHGYRAIWTPDAELYHFETQTRDKVSKPEDISMMYALWDHELHHDPYFNPNLAERRDDWVEMGLR